MNHAGTEDGSDGHRFCARCGTERTVGASSCENCGKSFVNVPGSQGMQTEPTRTQVGSVSRSPVSTSTSQSSRRRGRWWVVGTVLAVFVGATIVIFGVPQVRHNVFASAKSPKSTHSPSAAGSSSPTTATTSTPLQLLRARPPAPPTPQVSGRPFCAQQAGNGSGWSFTDSEGNKSEVNVCGYSLTGKLRQQRSCWILLYDHRTQCV